MADASVKKAETLISTILGQLNAFLETLNDSHEKIATSMGEIEKFYMQNAIHIKDKTELKKFELFRWYQIAAIARTHGSANELNGLMKCFAHWTSNLRPMLEKTNPETKKKAVSIPLKLAGFLFFIGEYYKAMDCLLHACILDPQLVEPRAILLKWAAFLGEYEFLERLLALNEKMPISGGNKKDKRLSFLLEVTKTFNDYYRCLEERDKKAQNIAEILECLENDKEQLLKPTYIHTERLVVTKYFAASISRSPDGKCSALNYLTGAALKAETIMKNRLPGITKNDMKVNFLTCLEDPIFCAESGSSFAEYIEISREFALEMFNSGLMREMAVTLEEMLKVACRSGILYRCRQVANLQIILDSNDQSRKDDLVGARNRLQLLCSTPEETAFEFRCYYAFPEPEPPVCDGKVTATVNKLSKVFSDLKLVEEQTLHRVKKFKKECSCEICFSVGCFPFHRFEYIISELLFRGANFDTMTTFLKGFENSRLVFAPEQSVLINIKNCKPRPPVACCEWFSLICMRWLRGLELDEVPKSGSIYANKRNTILQAVLKISKYYKNRCICYHLAAVHLQRVSSLPGAGGSYRWMRPRTPDEGPKRIFPKWTALIGCISPHVRHPSSEKSLNVTSDIAIDDLQEAEEEYFSYSHLLYREWRLPLTSFIARTTKNSWMAAMMFSEACMMSTRTMAQLKNSQSVAFKRCSIFQNCVKSLPSDFTVVQLLTDERGDLYFVKLHAYRDPLIVPACHSSRVAATHLQMENILEENSLSGNVVHMRNKTPEQFWGCRRKLDGKLKAFVHATQDYILGSFAPLLLPCQTLTLKGNKLAESLRGRAKTISTDLAIELVSLCTQISKEQWERLVMFLGQLYDYPTAEVCRIKKLYNKILGQIKDGDAFERPSSNLYTFLVICPELAQVPFETMPIFKNRPFVSRMPSFHVLYRLVNSSTVIPRKVNIGNSYYLLDPDNNLTQTQKRMMEVIGKYPWTGVSAKCPSIAEVKEALMEKDMYFYFGHGNGMKYVGGPKTVRDSTCKAVTVLMGCGSVKMKQQGWGLDGESTMYYYTIAQCPSLVGCLWMVTDGEIDRYFMRLIDLCFSDEGLNETLNTDDGSSRLRILMEAMNKAKEQSKLPYLTGAAVVCYGVPIVSEK